MSEIRAWFRFQSRSETLILFPSCSYQRNTGTIQFKNKSFRIHSWPSVSLTWEKELQLLSSLWKKILMYVQAGGGHPAYALSVPSAAIHGGSTGDISAVGEPTVLSSSLANSVVADPDRGSGAFLTPRSRMGKKSRSGIRIRGWTFWIIFSRAWKKYFGLKG